MTLVLPGKKKVSKMFAVVSSSLAKDSGKVELYEKEKDVKKTMPLATSELLKRNYAWHTFAKGAHATGSERV